VTPFSEAFEPRWRHPERSEGSRLPFKYQSGEEVKKGDRVLFHDQPGSIEFVADPATKNSETEWYVKEYGGGVMVVVPKVFGHVFLPTTEDAEDLILTSRLEDSVATD
jgi:hypothetical protein